MKKIKLSSFHTGPKQFEYQSYTDAMNRPIVDILDPKLGKYGVLRGPWINNGTWDGSYVIMLDDFSIAYLYPSKFKLKGYTVTEVLVRKEAKEKDLVGNDNKQ